MSYEPKAKLELIDSRDIDTLSTIMDQKTYPALSTAATNCFVKLGGMYELFFK